MKVKTTPLPGCVKTTVQEIYTHNDLQILKVDVEHNGEVPMHTHKSNVTMLVLSGFAHVIGDNNYVVQKGDIIKVKPEQPHGFTRVEQNLSFISIIEGDNLIQNGKYDISYCT